MHFIAEHYVILFNENHQNPGQSNDTFSYYGPINYLLYNGGYHVEHHDFPRVSWKNLPKIRALAGPEFYDNLPYHTSYIRVMWEFIW